MSDEVTGSGSEDDRHRVAWTAESLSRAVFAEQTDVIPGLFVEGLSILAGPPKAGKSWLSLQAGLDISRGDEFLEHAVRPGTEVLYLALEDGPRRLKSRIAASMAGARLTSFTGSSGGVRDGLHLFTAWPEGEKGIAVMRAWLEAHPAVKFVVVDVLAVLRGLARGGYSGDYRVMRGLKEIADHFGISVLVITHTRKSAPGGDPFAAIMGTSGVTGAADTLMVLRPVSVDGKLAALHVRGRDVESKMLELHLSDGRWFPSGAAAAERREERRVSREAVLDSLASEAASGLTAAEAGVMADVPEMIAAGVLDSAVRDGIARRKGDSRYVWIPVAERHGAGSGSGDGGEE